jgi:hypothetical protein
MPISKITAFIILLIGIFLMSIAAVSTISNHLPNIIVGVLFFIGFYLFWQIFMLSLYKTLKIKNRYLILFEIK